MGALAAALAAAALAHTPTAEALGLRPALGPAATRPSRRAAVPAPGGERLLELWVDGQNRGVLARVREQEDGRLLVASADLAAAGLPAGQDAMTALSEAGVAEAEVLAATQQLMLVTRHGPPTQVLDASGDASFVEPQSGAGFIVRYDLSAQSGQSSGTWSGGAALHAGVFTPKARLDAGGWLRAREDGARAVRLDTTLEMSDPARLRRLTVGDAVGSGLSWSRPVRFAGVQLARDFSLQPHLSTLPPIDFLGRADAPSSVDVFVGAARVFTGKVEAGPFEVRDIPVVTGRGEARVVVRDTLGRDTVATVPLYADADLLAPGLSDWSVEAGFLRRRYGLESFDYGAPVASASWRRGVSDGLTLQAHAEASPEVAVAGAGATFLAGDLGVAGVNLAAGGKGLLYALSFDSQFEGLRLFGSAMGTAGDFADVAAAEAGAPVPDFRSRLGASIDVGRRGALGLAWITERGGRADVDLASASYGWSKGGWYFGASGLYDARRDAFAGRVFLRAPLSANLAASASAGTDRTSARIERRADPDGGFGYALTAEPEDERLRAEASWYAEKAAVHAAVASQQGQAAGRVLVSGAVVGMDGALFSARAPEGGLALVKTGHPGVRVYRENRPVAVTDGRGRALLAGLTAHAKNRIGVNIADLPFDAEIPAAALEVSPKAGGGVVVDFTPPVTRPVLLVLSRPDGSFPDPGSLLALDGGGEVVVGRRGQAFLRDMTGPVAGVLRGAEPCRIRAEPPPRPAGEAISRLAALCHPVPQ